jgi:hypothetical protein
MATKKKPAAKRKVRRFAEGGFSPAQEQWLGGADRTDPYILARMRSAVPDETGPSESMIEDESGRGNISPNAAAFNKGTGNEPSVPVTKTITRTSVTAPAKVAPTKPTPESPEQYKARMEGLMKKDALEEVHPEDYVPGGGILKGMLGYVTRKGLKTYTPAAIRQLESTATRQLEAPAVRQLENNATKRIALDKSTYKSPVEKARTSRANDRFTKMQQENYDSGPAGRARASGAMVDDLTPGGADLLSSQLRPDFKRGGKIKGYKAGGAVKASKPTQLSKSNGIAKRGLTRGKIC